MRARGIQIGWLLVMLLGITACDKAAPDGADARLNVVATTTLVGDVVAQIGGEAINLTVLMPPGVDPHGFQPTPQDVVAVADADLVFANGLGVEVFLADLIANAGGDAQMVAVSDGIETITLADGDEHESEQADPHVWFDPDNVLVWVDHITEALSEEDPDNAAIYAANAHDYQAELADLMAWMDAQIAEIPAANRVLVTDHDALGYFIRRYDFTLVGVVIPGYSTQTAPSAEELAALQDAIRSTGAAAIFVNTSVNLEIAEQVAEDTGVQLVPIYTGSLSTPDGPAANYINFMRHNTTAIVQALR